MVCGTRARDSEFPMRTKEVSSGAKAGFKEYFTSEACYFRVAGGVNPSF